MSQFQSIKDQTLYDIYQLSREPEFDFPIPFDDIANVVPEISGSFYAQKVISALVDDGYLEKKVSVSGALMGYQISGHGIYYVEGQFELPDSIIAKYAAKLEVEKNSTQSQTEDVWEPLKIDKAATDYVEAVEKVETAIAKIRADNGYASTEPEERDNIVGALDSGLTRLKNGMPTRDELRALLLRPLKYITKRFADTALGEVAKAAFAALMKLLSGSI